MTMSFDEYSPSPIHSRVHTPRLSRSARRRYRTALIVVTLALAILSGTLLFLRTTSSAAVTIDSFFTSTRTVWAGATQGWQDVWDTNRKMGEAGWAEDEVDIPDVDIGMCEGWSPDGEEDDDPEGCLTARQYRQVSRVLAREEKAEQCVNYPTRSKFRS
jgi:hypothetical protein